LETKHNHIEEHEDTKGIIRIRKSKKDRNTMAKWSKEKEQKGKQLSVKKYTEN
jgi:hypothetical protein